MPVDVFTVPSDEIDGEAIRRFVDNAISTRIQAESSMLEFKSQPNKSNVAEAVAALSNTHDGIVLVGIDEAKEEPIVGIPASDVDRIVTQLRALLPYAMPEVIPVAVMSKSKTVVLVLRVDPDRIDTPVVLEGRILVRIPGATVGASRDEILSLVNRNQSAYTGWPAGPGVEVASLNLETESDAQPLQVRVHSRLWLPRHVVGREWLGTTALYRAQEELTQSPIPRLIDSDQLHEHHLSDVRWRRTESISLTARFASTETEPGPLGRPGLSGLAHVTLQGRSLDVVLATSVMWSEGNKETWGIEFLRECLLAGASTATKVGAAVAAAIDAHIGMAPPVLSAWVGGHRGLAGMHLNREWFDWDQSPTLRTEWRFSETPLPKADLDSIDQLVMRWLTGFLFNSGALGFEEHLSAIPLPRWAMHHVSEQRD